MNKNADILIIDDEQVIIDSIIKISGLEGWRVDSVEDAAIALEKFDLTAYRLIICDIMMPRVDGFQFLKELEKRKIPTPVIMITGYTTVENAVKSLQQGAIDFLPKPFTVDELLSIVQRGLTFSDISQLIRNDERANIDSQVFVSCPHKYYRLGWISWIDVEKEGTVLVGITDLYTKTIPGITKIELQEANDRLTQGNVCATIYTADEMSYNVISPVSGKIIERNEKLFENCKLPEKDPYFKGWFYRMIPTDLEYELKFLSPCSSDRI